MHFQCSTRKCKKRESKILKIWAAEEQDDPKPLLTKYWISPLAVTPCVTLCPPARLLNAHLAEGRRPYNQQTQCPRTIGNTTNAKQKQKYRFKCFIYLNPHKGRHPHNQWTQSTHCVGVSTPEYFCVNDQCNIVNSCDVKWSLFFYAAQIVCNI